MMYIIHINDKSLTDSDKSGSLVLHVYTYHSLHFSEIHTHDVFQAIGKDDFCVISIRFKINDRGCFDS